MRSTADDGDATVRIRDEFSIAAAKESHRRRGGGILPIRGADHATTPPVGTIVPPSREGAPIVAVPRNGRDAGSGKDQSSRGGGGIAHDDAQEIAIRDERRRIRGDTAAQGGRRRGWIRLRMML